MTFDYNKTQKQRMVITLENGVTVEGMYLDLRITPETIPAGKIWYQIRHCDNDWIEPATLKKGCVMVNFMVLLSQPLSKGWKNGVMKWK